MMSDEAYCAFIRQEVTFTTALSANDTGDTGLRYADATLATVTIRDVTMRDVQDVDRFMDFKEWSHDVIVPCICAFGILGNTLSLVVFSRRLHQGPDTMERSATYGLLTLAICDLFFCILTVTGVFMEEQIIYQGRSAAYFYNMYGSSLNNMLTGASIWLTVVIGVERYAIVCHPIKARQYMKFLYTKLAIVGSIFFSILLYLPLLWEKSVIHVQCEEDDFYMIDYGRLYSDVFMRMGCVYAWIILGLIVPLCILAFCNICLIRALQQSWKSNIRVRQHTFNECHQNSRRTPDMNNETAGKPHEAHAMVPLSQTPYDHAQKCRSRSLAKKKKEQSAEARGSPQGRRITVILILLIVMVFVFLGPSECVNFYIMAVPSAKHASGSSKWHVLNAISVTNILLACHFSLNFILYCVIHQYFRKTIAGCVRRLLRRHKNSKPNNCSYASTTIRTQVTSSSI